MSFGEKSMNEILVGCYEKLYIRLVLLTTTSNNHRGSGLAERAFASMQVIRESRSMSELRLNDRMQMIERELILTA